MTESKSLGMTKTFTPQPITLYICDRCDRVVSGNRPPSGPHYGFGFTPLLYCKGRVHEVKYAPLATAESEGSHD